MRLADFIRTEIEPILEDWEEFAKTILHAGHMDKTGLRDHARDMLLVIADDLDSHQNKSEQTDKSKGIAPADDEESWAEVHGGERQTSGFSVIETVSEFRALVRASYHNGLKPTRRFPDRVLKISLGSTKPSIRLSRNHLRIMPT